MNDSLNTLASVNPTPATSRGAAAAAAIPATATPGESGAFAQLMGAFAQSAAAIAPPEGTGSRADAATGQLPPQTIASAALAPAPAVAQDDAPGSESSETMPTPPQPDAALIAALLGQMQMPSAMLAPAAPAGEQMLPANAVATSPSPSDIDAVLTMANANPQAPLQDELRQAAYGEPGERSALSAEEGVNAAQRAPLSRAQPSAGLQRLLEPNATTDEGISAADIAALPAAAAGAATLPRGMVFTQEQDAGGNRMGELAAISSMPFALTSRGDSPAPNVTIAPRLDSPQWQPAFTHNIKLLVAEGMSSASLQLNPAEFGPIEVRIVVTDLRADIAFLVAHPDANTAIQSSLSDLREQLARSGIQLGQTSVGAHPQHSQQSHQSQQPRHTTDTPRQGAADGPVLPSSTGTTPHAPLRRSGSIDIYA